MKFVHETINRKEKYAQSSKYRGKETTRNDNGS
jgi:hypothetical protein